MQPADIDALFNQLDTDKNGRISRADLYRAALRLRWHWHEAPLYAVLDLLCLVSPLSPQDLTEAMTEIAADPLGPYGGVLRRAHPLYRSAETFGEDPPPAGPEMEGECHRIGRKGEQDAVQRFLEGFTPATVSARSAALLLIDPQRSFTEGAWMRSIGPEAQSDTATIRSAFAACADLLSRSAAGVEALFTRCPFPPGSYGWDRRLAETIGSKTPYFIKPGNDLFFPPTNGFSEWLKRSIQQGKKTLVIGGCTLNSCVRVTAAQVQMRFGSDAFRVVVDLSLCGARSRNYLPSRRFGGKSAVSSAVSQMEAAGIDVVRQVHWR